MWRKKRNWTAGGAKSAEWWRCDGARPLRPALVSRRRGERNERHTFLLINLFIFYHIKYVKAMLMMPMPCIVHTTSVYNQAKSSSNLHLKVYGTHKKAVKLRRTQGRVSLMRTLDSVIKHLQSVRRAIRENILFCNNYDTIPDSRLWCPCIFSRVARRCARRFFIAQWWLVNLLTLCVFAIVYHFRATKLPLFVQQRSVHRAGPKQ